MEYKMLPVVSATDIEKAVLAQYNEYIELCQLFWEGEYTNDSLKRLWISKLVDEEEIEWYGEEEVRHINLVISILQDQFYPKYDYVLVDVSW